MRTSRTIALIGITLISLLAVNSSFAQSGLRQIIKTFKSSLAPYEYDSYAYNKIALDPDQAQHVEVEFKAFVGGQYKIIFCTSGFQEQVKINIYDKSKIFKKRNRIYDSSESEIDNIFFPFEIENPGTYYVSYDIPPSRDKKVKKGYVVMLIGRKSYSVKNQLASSR